MRPEYVSRAHRESTGRHLGADLKRLQVEHAAWLLRATDFPISDVIKLAGYLSGATFYRQFKREFGIPPGMYRRAADDAAMAAGYDIRPPRSHEFYGQVDGQ